MRKRRLSLFLGAYLRRFGLWCWLWRRGGLRLIEDVASRVLTTFLAGQLKLTSAGLRLFANLFTLFKLRGFFLALFLLLYVLFGWAFKLQAFFFQALALFKKTSLALVQLFFAIKLGFAFLEVGICLFCFALFRSSIRFWGGRLLNNLIKFSLFIGGILQFLVDLFIRQKVLNLTLNRLDVIFNALDGKLCIVGVKLVVAQLFTDVFRRLAVHVVGVARTHLDGQKDVELASVNHVFHG